ncbi:hypothetical protein MBLNU230_g3148t1 [Neophaeotheca triangularis]
MMNNHMPPGPGQYQPPMPMHQHQQRQAYHQYHHGPPQSPMHPYANNFHPGQYYPPPQPRWQQPPHHFQSQHYGPPPPQQMHTPYQQPRSPMVVSSQPLQHHHQQSMTPMSQHRMPMYPPTQPQIAQSPRPIPPPQRGYSQTSIQSAPSPASMPAKQATPPAPPSRRQSIAQSPLSLPPEHKTPFYPTLPWYSPNATSFPPRASTRRKRRQSLHTSNDVLALPNRTSTAGEEAEASAGTQKAEDAVSETSTVAAPSAPETPATSHAPSESDDTQVSTPVTTVQASSPKATPTQTHARRDTRTAIAVPNIPNLPKQKTSPSGSGKEQAQLPEGEKTPTSTEPEKAQTQQTSEEQTRPATPPKPAAPKSWADLVRSKQAASAAPVQVNGTATNGVPKSASLTDALRQYNVQNDASLSFLEPRGLVNTGNMCYMNSVLQVLTFCVPFYNFLDQVRQRTVQSMKSETPLLDATIMFMREFKVLAEAESAEQLRSKLSQQTLEQYGDSVTPEYVYDVVRKLPRFSSMRRGQQQDAEEFLGFFLEGLHDECMGVMAGQPETTPAEPEVTSPTGADGWLEVGPKQKSSVTRHSGGEDAPTPITKIFGGHLRSELRVPGLKDSVTLEPYKPLQLDIGASHVNNIVDALKSITRTETLTGDFGGRGTTAKKQVFIDTLPPVLVLHLKRFQYDNTMTGTQKIWKKVGYPLELEIPKEVFPTAKRGALAVKGGQPKYKLTGVVYHHGKSAAGGHYTVDVLRQDGREWVRMDDTLIRRIRSEEVAEGGSEEDPKILAKALEQHKADMDLKAQRAANGVANMYEGLDEAEREPEEEKPWSEVNGHGANGVGGAGGHRSKSSWAAGLAPGVSSAGTATPATGGKRTPQQQQQQQGPARKEGVKDNKVAYILLYERMRG